jgi:SAM-dependent methyltransferase
VLELASGTGQLVAWFAAAAPEIEWWPTERAPIWLESIAGWTTGLDNVREPTHLDIGETPWPTESFDAVLALNVLHLLDSGAITAVFENAAAALAEGGALITSGVLADGESQVIKPAVAGWGVTIQPPRLEDLQAAAAASGFSLETNDPLPGVSTNHWVIRWRLA